MNLTKLFFGAILLLFFSVPTYSQVMLDLDSLKTELDKRYKPQKETGGWANHKLIYSNEAGKPEFSLALDREGKPAEGAFGITLTMYKYDNKGRVKERRYYGPNGKLHFSDWPPVIKEYYAENGKPSRKDYFGEDGQPISSFCRLEIDYNKEGDPVEERMFDWEGKYVLKGDRCVTRFEYSEGGRVVTESRYNGNGDLNAADGVAYTVETYRSSARELLLEKKYLDESGAPVMIVPPYNLTKPHSRILYDYSQPKRRNETYLDLDSNVVESKSIMVFPSKASMTPSGSKINNVVPSIKNR